MVILLISNHFKINQLNSCFQNLKLFLSNSKYEIVIQRYTKSVLFEIKTGMTFMNEICLVEVHNPVVIHLIDQSRKSIVPRDHELVNKIKPRKGKFQRKARCNLQIFVN